MRCVKVKSDKKTHMNIKKGDVENMTGTINDKVNKKNDNSSQSREYPISSTPLRRMHSTNAEDSPDIDRYPSPIYPCTQEGNEVAWDWQGCLNKTPENRTKKQNVQFDTPKGTKLLHRKRNSNSPLYKPLKRKTIKMQNIENIGQFAAELQALDEKLRFIKQTDKNSSDSIEEKLPVLANANKEEDIRIQDEEQDCIEKIDNCDNTGKNEANGSYDDLFDDSIDDSMARCTQEIEEKFNLISDNSPHSQTSSKKELLSDKTSIEFTSDDIRKPSIRHFHHKSISDSHALKTYSKLSLKKDASSSILTSIQKEKDLHKSYLSNKICTHKVEKSDDNLNLPQKNIVELFDIPDDSFDDCLATCIEDDKLLSTPTKSDNLSNYKNDDAKYRPSCKQLIQAPLRLEAKSANSLKTAARDETSSPLENRKFFKTRSLSDQYIGQDATTSRNTSDASFASCFMTRIKSHLNSTKNTTTTHTNVTRGFVSNNPIVTNDCKVKDNAISLIRDTGWTHGSDVNRCVIKEDGDRFGRCNSTGNMKNDGERKMTRSGSQPIRYTAEEIEQKRLQAKMRLEAKKKLHALKIINNINR